MPSTCSVSGNLQDLTGTGIAGFAVFTLANYGSNVPRVVGTTMIASPKKVFQANGSGAISGNLWGNDNISPAGTVYFVTIEDTSRNPIATYAFSITGTSFNLNTQTPITVAPVVTAPTGDSTYLRLDGGNKPNGNTFFLALVSESANPSQSGVIRLSNSDLITARNLANSGDFSVVAVIGNNLVVGDAAMQGANIVPLVTTYNNQALTGQGFPSILSPAVDLTAQQADITTTLWLSAPAGALYRASAYVVLTRAGSVSSTLPSAVIGFTDKDSSFSTSLTLSSTSTANTVGTFQQGSGVVSIKSGTNINYQTSGYASSGGTTMQFALHMKLELLG